MGILIIIGIIALIYLLKPKNPKEMNKMEHIHDKEKSELELYLFVSEKLNTRAKNYLILNEFYLPEHLNFVLDIFTLTLSIKFVNKAYGKIKPNASMIHSLTYHYFKLNSREMSKIIIDEKYLNFHFNEKSQFLKVFYPLIIDEMGKLRNDSNYFTTFAAKLIDEFILHVEMIDNSFLKYNKKEGKVLRPSFVYLPLFVHPFSVPIMIEIQDLFEKEISNFLHYDDGELNYSYGKFMNELIKCYNETISLIDSQFKNRFSTK